MKLSGPYRSGAWYGQRSPDIAENTRQDKELDKSFANGKLVGQELLGSQMRGAANRKTPPTPSPTHVQDDLQSWDINNGKTIMVKS